MKNHPRVLIGDCIEQMRRIEATCVHTCVTSPPYFGLRDYGVEGQIGLEETPALFIAKMVDVFREVRRVLRDDGTLWINIGDSYAGSWGATGQRESEASEASWRGSKIRNHPKRAAKTASTHQTDLKPKDLIGIPWMLAFALRADGWYLRQEIIWHKPNPMPESVSDRCTKAHEHIFLLSKSRRYYFDATAIAEPANLTGKGFSDSFRGGAYVG
ncbi:site-specific DNA-methyltransferase, partial [Thioclava sp. BHET1]